MTEYRCEPCAFCKQDVKRRLCGARKAKRLFCNRDCFTRWRRDNPQFVIQQMNTPTARVKARETERVAKEAGQYKAPMTGRTHTASTREKMSQTRSDLIATGKIKQFGHNKHGHYTSTKTGVEMYHRSSWELAFMKWLDADPRVVSYQYESIRIPYCFNGNKRWYVPDFLVEWTGGVKYMYELKPKEFLDDERTQKKAFAACGYAHNNGLHYDVLTREKLVEMGVL